VLCGACGASQLRSAQCCCGGWLPSSKHLRVQWHWQLHAQDFPLLQLLDNFFMSPQGAVLRSHMHMQKKKKKKRTYLAYF
jgi:hypothetical protein